MKTIIDNIIKEKYQREEWGGWKIVSEMLDNPDECGIYPTGKCYQKLYDFVCEQKKKAVENYKLSLKLPINNLNER